MTLISLMISILLGLIPKNMSSKIFLKEAKYVMATFLPHGAGEFIIYGPKTYLWVEHMQSWNTGWYNCTQLTPHCCGKSKTGYPDCLPTQNVWPFSEAPESQIANGNQKSFEKFSTFTISGKRFGFI